MQKNSVIVAQFITSKRQYIILMTRLLALAAYANELQLQLVSYLAWLIQIPFLKAITLILR